MGLACFPLSFSLQPSLPKVIDSLGCCAPLLCSTQFGHCQEEGPRQAFWGGCARLEGDYNSGRSGESIQQGDRPGRMPPWTTWDTLAVMTPKRRGYGGQSSPSSAGRTWSGRGSGVLGLWSAVNQWNPLHGMQYWPYFPTRRSTLFAGQALPAATCCAMALYQNNEHNPLRPTHMVSDAASMNDQKVEEHLPRTGWRPRPR